MIHGQDAEHLRRIFQPLRRDLTLVNARRGAERFDLSRVGRMPSDPEWP